MACEGYEHGERVELVARIPNQPMIEGSIGEIVSIDSLRHKLDVNFRDYGLIRGLDAHAFQSLAMPL